MKVDIIFEFDWDFKRSITYVVGKVYYARSKAFIKKVKRKVKYTGRNMDIDKAFIRTAKEVVRSLNKSGYIVSHAKFDSIGWSGQFS